MLRQWTLLLLPCHQASNALPYVKYTFIAYHVQMFKLTRTRILEITGSIKYNWSPCYVIHTYFLGIIDLGPESTPDGEPLVFSSISAAMAYLYHE